jgi:hypothetical protein
MLPLKVVNFECICRFSLYRPVERRTLRRPETSGYDNPFTQLSIPEGGNNCVPVIEHGLEEPVECCIFTVW